MGPDSLALELSLGDDFGIIALLLIASTAVLMLYRRVVLKRSRNLERLRRVHLYVATAAGSFLVLHAAFFIGVPVTQEVVVGYGAAVVALFVWVTGTAFLEKLRDSLFYHGSMSLTAIALMAVHAASAAANFPAWPADAVMLAIAGVVFWWATMHVKKAVK